jgi:hypothetical protein
MRKHLSWLLPLLLFVAGCFGPTAYQPTGYTGGYTEQKLNDSAYLVTFAGNGFATKERIHIFWLYRCAELTVQNGYDYFILRSKEPAPPKNAQAGMLVPATYHPGQPGKLIKAHAGGYSAPVYVYGGGGGTITRWTSSAIVIMFKKPLAKELPFALDARKVMEELHEYITSDGKSITPDTILVSHDAMVAHAKIDFGDMSAHEVAPPVPPPADAPVFPPRSPHDIQFRIDWQLALFQYAYHEHQMRGADARPGQVVVAFDILPSGIVSNCRVLSSTIQDPLFQDTLTTLLRRIDFGVQNSATLSVTSLPITFTPLPD